MSNTSEKPTPLDRDGRDPLYVQLRELLQGQIDSGRLLPGSKLPSARELGETYDVSRITVRQAIKDLDNMGYLDTWPGKGIFVANRKPAYEFESLRSFTETAERYGRTPAGRLLTGRILPAPLDLARWLDLGVGTPVIELERLRFLDGDPVVIQTDWLAASRAPGLLKIDWENGNHSLYHELTSRYGVIPIRGQSTIGARLATPREQDLLGIAAPGAVLTLDQIAYDAEERPVNASTMAYHPVRYQMTLTQGPYRD